MSLRPLWIGCLIWGVAVVVAACGDGEAEPGAECERGETRLCRTENGCLGERRCSGAPLKWQACECPANSSAPLLSNAGDQCESDAECAGGDVCLDGDHDFLGGALVAGTCVVDCAQDPGVCSRLSVPSVCVKASTGEISLQSMAADGDERAYCFESCRLGSEDEQRCHGRSDTACSELAEGQSFCRPLCVSDDDCPGRHCDTLLGVCVNDPVGGSTLGVGCDAEADDPGCQGVCLDVNDVNFCSGRCIYGSADDCGVRDLGRPGLCFLPEGEGSIGDVGFCALLCDCNGQCPNPEMICDPFLDVPLEELLQAKGICLPAESSVDGGVDAGAVTGGIPCPLQ